MTAGVAASTDSELTAAAPRAAEPPMRKVHWRNAMPSILVGLLIVAALVLVAESRFRRGATVLSAAMLLTAALRLFLPTQRMGSLVVRSRGFDVLFCAGLGSLLLWLVIDP